jgi:hypothetical protein
MFILYIKSTGGLDFRLGLGRERRVRTRLDSDGWVDGFVRLQGGMFRIEEKLGGAGKKR